MFNILGSLMYFGAYQAKCKISKSIGGSLLRQDHLLCLLCFFNCSIIQFLLFQVKEDGGDHLVKVLLGIRCLCLSPLSWFWNKKFYTNDLSLNKSLLDPQNNGSMFLRIQSNLVGSTEAEPRLNCLCFPWSDEIMRLLFPAHISNYSWVLTLK